MPGPSDPRRASYPSIIPTYSSLSGPTNDLARGCGCPECRGDISASTTNPRPRIYMQPASSRNLRPPTYRHRQSEYYATPRTSQPNLTTCRDRYGYISEPATTTDRARIPPTYRHYQRQDQHHSRHYPVPTFRRTPAQTQTQTPVAITQTPRINQTPRFAPTCIPPTPAKTPLQVYDFTSLLPDTDAGRRFTLDVTESTSTRGVIMSLAPPGSKAMILVRETNGGTRRLSEWERLFELGTRRCTLEIVDC